MTEEQLAAIEARLTRPYPMDGTDLLREVRRLQAERDRLRAVLEMIAKKTPGDFITHPLLKAVRAALTEPSR